jgi:mRNA interferase RelE/StbE
VSYQVVVPKAVQKQILKLPEEVQEWVFTCLSGLQEIPRPTGCIKMKGVSGYRIRIGDYRVLYDVDDIAQTVTLRRVGHRKEIYRSL